MGTAEKWFQERKRIRKIRAEAKVDLNILNTPRCEIKRANRLVHYVASSGGRATGGSRRWVVAKTI
jgi:hypothetical protein